MNIWEQIYCKDLKEVPWVNLENKWFHELLQKGVLKGESAIDLGCGIGQLSLSLANNGFKEVLGIDISERAVEIARKNAKATGVASVCSFSVADLLKYDSKGKTYDLVLDWAFIHCVSRSKHQRYSELISSLVHPGSLLLLRYFHSPNGTVKRFSIGGASKIEVLDEYEVLSLFDGFEVLKKHQTDIEFSQEIRFNELLLRK